MNPFWRMVAAATLATASPCVAPSLASAADPQPVPAVPLQEDEALAVVRELPDHPIKDSLLDSMQRDLTNMIAIRGGVPDDKATEIVTTVFMPDLGSHYIELETALAAIWREKFTPDELHQLLLFARNKSPAARKAFGTSPLGMKYYGVQTEIEQQSSAQSQEWATRTLSASAKSHAADLKAAGLNVGN